MTDEKGTKSGSIIMQSQQEIIDLVSKQGKAPVDWVAKILHLDAEDLRAKVSQLGLVLEEDYLSLPLKETRSIVKKTQETRPKTYSERYHEKVDVSEALGYSRPKIMPRNILSWFALICSVISLLGSGFLTFLGIVSMVALWEHWYIRYFAEFYMLFVGFILLLLSIVSIGYFSYRIRK